MAQALGQKTMRTKKTILTIALLASLCMAGLISAPFQANATGNVLLPSTSSGNDDRQPNLGLVPQIKPAPTAPTTATPQAQATDAPAPAPTLQTAAPTVSIVPPSSNAEPAPAANASTAAALLSKLLPPQQTSMPAAQQPSIARSGSTIIIKSTTPPALPTQFQISPELQKYLPASMQMSRLTISLSNRSVWGPSDIINISDKLGMPQKQVTETCILSLQGVVSASKSTTTFNTGSNGTGEAQYNGAINKIHAQMSALCPATTQVPSGKGVINQLDDKYVIRLGAGSCSPSQSSPPTQLTVTYAGNGRAQCDFQ